MSDEIHQTTTAAAVGTSNLPVPYLYSRTVSKDGCTYYQNHVTKTTSWCHPVKLAELQAAGFVASTSSDSSTTVAFVEAGDFDKNNYPVPAPWQRQKTSGAGGEIEYEYKNTKTGETVFRHPKALELGRRGREGASSGETVNVTSVNLQPEEEWTSKGLLPPWVVEEEVKKVKKGGKGKAGQKSHYWVDYRDGTKNTQSPLQIYTVKQKIAAEQRSGNQWREGQRDGEAKGWKRYLCT